MWPAVWGVLRRVPGWLWLAIATVLTGGLYLRERRARLAAERRSATIEAIGSAAVAHIQATARADADAARAMAEAEFAHAGAAGRIREGLAEAGAVVSAEEAQTAEAVDSGGQALTDEVERVAARRRKRRLRVIRPSDP